MLLANILDEPIVSVPKVLLVQVSQIQVPLLSNKHSHVNKMSQLASLTSALVIKKTPTPEILAAPLQNFLVQVPLVLVASVLAFLT